MTIRILIHILIRMNITTYIRKEDEHLWHLIENKSQWIHEQLNQLTPTPVPRKPVKVPDVPGLMAASELKEPTCPRHHVAKSMCVGRH